MKGDLSLFDLTYLDIMAGIMHSRKKSASIMTLSIFWILSLISLSTAAASKTNFSYDRVAFVINSQPDNWNKLIAEETMKNLRKSLEDGGISKPVIHLVHESNRVAHHGAWTYFPTIINLADEENIDWAVFLEDNAVVKVDHLKDILRNQDPNSKLFFGHAMRDKDSTVIHHYDPPGINYPHPEAGFILSSSLMKAIADHIESGSKAGFPESFSIDPQYELAKVVLSLDGSEKNPVKLKHLKDQLCYTVPKDLSKSSCAIYPRDTTCKADRSTVMKLAKKTLFAVKTCKALHDIRLPVITNTWVEAAINVIFFSDSKDDKYNTLVLHGVKNTERGHCRKTETILKYFNNKAREKGWKWLVVTDDDTILGVYRTLEFLSCFNSTDVLHMGQRYGFKVALGKYGYDYITGGGGMIFSKAAVKKLLEKEQHCACPRDNHPDDMHFGACMTNLAVPLVHSSRFHQGRPEDYSQKLLVSSKPISFHKFWQTEPEQTYNKYFRWDDKVLKDFKYNIEHPHQEL